MVSLNVSGDHARVSTGIDHPTPAQLPQPLTSLVDRHREIAEVRALLQRPEARLVTLTGPGGIGKTRIAIEVANSVRLDTTTSVAFVGLAPVSKSELVPAVVGSALGIVAEGENALLDRLPAAIGKTTFLLVLDNMEHLIAAAPLAGQLLESCPTLNILVTSRSPLHVSGEIQFGVQPLDTASPDDPEELIAESSGYRLFVDRAAQYSNKSALDTRGVAAVCSQLDGLPLAIELAAARIRILSVPELLHRLERPLPLLGDGPRDAPQRLRSMRDTISWSYDLLPADEQRLFRYLSVFRGGFTLTAIEAVAPIDLQMSILDAFSHLVEHNLVRRSSSEDASRFSMHMAVREYAEELLQSEGEESDARERHVAWICADIADSVSESWVVVKSDYQAHVPVEHENFRHALSWSVASNDGVRASLIARGLDPFWTKNGLHQEGLRSLRLVSEMNGDIDSAVRASILRRISTHAFMASEFDDARDSATEALTICEESGDLVGVQRSLETLGNAAMDVDPPTGLKWHTASVELSRKLGDPYRLACSLYGRSQCLIANGDPCQAQANAAEALEILDAIPNTSFGRACALWHIAWSAGMLGEFEKAAKCATAGLVLGRETGMPSALRSTLRPLGELALRQRDYAKAADCFGEALGLAFRDNVPTITAALLIEFGVLAQATGDFSRAARLFGAADEEWNRQPSLVFMATWENDQQPTRLALGNDRFGQEFENGRAMSPAEAYREAMEYAPPVAIQRTAAGELTRREQQVLDLVAQGMTNKEIAGALFVGTTTIDTHVAKLIAKLGARSRWTAVNEARRRGLLDR